MTTNDRVAIDPIELILRRRSHRVGFDATAVSRDVLAAIVECGCAAPSSKNAQPWRFHALDDRTSIAAIADLVATSVHAADYVPRDPHTNAVLPGWESTVVESAAILRSAPAAVFVENLGRFGGRRSDLSALPATQLEGRLVAVALELAGIGAAVQNMWLAANALGLQASFVGDVGVAEDEIRTLLGFSGDLLGALALGHSSVGPEPKRPLDDDRPRVVWHPDAVSSLGVRG